LPGTRARWIRRARRRSARRTVTRHRSGAGDADRLPVRNRLGDSIARWEGSTLVVDSVGYNDETWLGIYGWFHSSKLHVVERLSRVGDTLHYQATVDDPEVFTRPWTMNPWVSVKTNEPILENPPCVETDIDHVTSFDEKTKR